MLPLNVNYSIKIVPGALICGFEADQPLHVRPGNLVTFINETPKTVLVKFKDPSLFGRNYIFLNPAPDRYMMEVIEGEPVEIVCSVDCSYELPDYRIEAYDVKPTILINRD